MTSSNFLKKDINRYEALMIPSNKGILGALNPKMLHKLTDKSYLVLGTSILVDETFTEEDMAETTTAWGNYVSG